MKKKFLAALLLASVILGVALGTTQQVYADEVNDPIYIEPFCVLPPPKGEDY